MKVDATRALIAYSGVLTCAFAWVLLTGAQTPKTTQFDTIDVKRINLREDDGTLRMVIAGKSRFPGYIMHGHERPSPGRRDSAGMLFFNDEGSENGGLIFGGAKTHGRVSSFGHLSFDQYDQDQVVKLEQTEEDGQRAAGLTIDDRPQSPLPFDFVDGLQKLPAAQREAALEKARAEGRFGHERLFAGKTEDRDSVVALRDASGRERLRLRVTAAGQAAVEFLDGDGKVARTLTPQG